MTPDGRAKEPPKPSGRLFYLDWLRVLAILSVFFLHTAKIFDFHTRDVFNPVASAFWSAYRELNLFWIMPLFFAISGAAVFFSLRPGGGWAFVKSRLIRLVVPLVFLGTFVINPLYVYAIRLFQGKASSGFLAWYPEFFHGWWGFGGNFAPLGHGTHLWYLEFLFIYSLLLLPLFLRAQKRRAAGQKTLADRFQGPWGLFLLFLPVSMSEALFELAGLGGARVMGGWSQLSYLWFFWAGFMLFANPASRETIARHGPLFLALAVALSWLHLDSHFGFNLIVPGLTRHDLAAGGGPRPISHSVWVGVQFFRGIAGWAWVLGLLGVGARVLNFRNRFLDYANPAVLPFYILHHSIILLAACLVLGWDLGPNAKFLLIALISLAVIMALYEGFVRRLAFLRFLFGMKKRKRVGGK